ncbi:Uma2 family endonuclease [Aquisphaera insulae]|uniref:Uma2 family endonuclease n=1 Tax=Aquisphaera insulae TaxID=2712864 RepID=UPI0013EA9754|nr:Uma2 family endonuclease [Aquisphaera insulae]
MASVEMLESTMTWTPQRYGRAIDAGLFEDLGMVELIGGQLVATSIEEAPNRDVAINAEESLKAMIPSHAWFVGREVTVEAADSVLVPDVLVARGSWKPRYRRRNPRIDELALAIEVADTTLCRDRRLKVPFDLEAGVPIVWVVNVAESRVEVYSPAGGPDAPTAHGIVIPYLLLSTASRSERSPSRTSSIDLGRRNALDDAAASQDEYEPVGKSDRATSSGRRGIQGPDHDGLDRQKRRVILNQDHYLDFAGRGNIVGSPFFRLPFFGPPFSGSLRLM